SGTRRARLVQREHALHGGFPPRRIARVDVGHRGVARATLLRREAYVIAANEPEALVGQERTHVVGRRWAIELRDDRLQERTVFALPGPRRRRRLRSGRTRRGFRFADAALR